MKAVAIFALALVWAVPHAAGWAAAAEPPAGPLLEVTFDDREAIPGQPLSLRMTVLVPTFMPKPPVWPTLETPNLLVRLPEGSTNPTSKRIGGETWSGVTRHYRLSPMVPGAFSIPPQKVEATWKDPVSGIVETVVLTTEAINLRGILPAGAEGLDPFVAATALELTQTIDGTPGGMVPGDSLTRRVTARVEGVSPMFLPPLLPPAETPGLAAYPDQAIIEEAGGRGDISGTRTERVTYVAEGGGGGTLQAVSLDWFDIGAGEVRTALLDSVEVSVDGPPLARTESRAWRALALAVIASVVAATTAVLLIRRAAPAIRRYADHRRRAYFASEGSAWRVLSRAVAAHDHAALRPALDVWAARVSGRDPRCDPRVEAALASLGAACYAPKAQARTVRPAEAWTELRRALPALRKGTRADRRRGALPPLNPDTAIGR